MHDIAKDIWVDDRLGRAEQAEYLKTFLLNRIAEKTAAGQRASYVLNLNAEWGQGKSFFLCRFAEMLRADGYLVAEVNAWNDDHADDPLLSVMDCIDVAVAPVVKGKGKAQKAWDAVKSNAGAIAIAGLKGVVVQATKRIVGDAADKIGELMDSDSIAETGKEAASSVAKSVGEVIDQQGKALLEKFRQGKRTISSFRSSIAAFLQAVSSKQKLPLFVFVDELDRCRPPFAIAMLERIKHLFELDQVVFVVATDTKQLRHSIRAVYGAEFDSEGYLSRFFNRAYHFEPISRRKFIEDLWNRASIAEDKLSMPPDNEALKFLIEAFDYFNLAPRDIEQAYDIIRTFVTAWSIDHKIEFVILVPLVVAYQMHGALPLNGNFAEHLKTFVAKMGGRAFSLDYPI
ncbi:KAP family P-loop NTPase fold protein [Nitrobacter sp.]|uniref:KAP family P-loop NTPase fold protein n=1 Tax=Nitrobacter sp. TaxID=29420 RepID=UPI003F649401